MGFINNEMVLTTVGREYFNQVAIVTGASRGLGRHIAIYLAQLGINVIFTYKSRSDQAQLVYEDITSQGGQCKYYQLDVTKDNEVQEFFSLLSKDYSHIDILINNAGISIDGVSWKLSSENWQAVIDTNLKGTFLCTKFVLPFMRGNGYGRIINIASVVAECGVPGAVAYGASKAGVIGLTRTIAKEVAQKGITVNALALGYFNEGLLNSIDQETLKVLKEQIPMKRFGEINELLWAIHFLCAPQASYITGEVININGGFYMG